MGSNDDLKVEDSNHEISVVRRSPSLRIAIHGLSELINTRLSTEALDICVDLIETGVHPRPLSEEIWKYLDLRENDFGNVNSPKLP